MCPISYAQPVTHQITWVENGALVNETLGHTPHCGQPHPHPSLVHTNQFRARDSLRIADNHDGTHHWRTPMKAPGGTTRRDATDQREATEVAGTAATTVPTAGRKSSTGRRVRPHTPTNSTSTTRPTTHSQKPRYGPHSALRTTTAAPIIGAHPRTIDRGHSPHCGQLRLHQQPVLTHGPRSWRSRKN